MKKGMLFIFTFIMGSGSCKHKSSENKPVFDEGQGVVFDSLQAAKADADDFGIKQYVINFDKRTKPQKGK